MKVKKESKCGQCSRFIPQHIRIIKCADCLRFYHAKCSNTSVQSFQTLKRITWTCNKCSLTYLPFANIDNDNFKQTLHALDKQKTRDKLDILPSFKIRTLLDKMPRQTVGFDDLYHNRNSSTYYDIPQFTNKNFND